MSIYKNDSGMYLTKSLFIELCYGKPEHAIYTTKNEDHVLNGKTYTSFKKRYLEIADPVEYETAQQLCDGWDHWKELTNSVALAPLIQECRDELDMKIRSEAVKVVAQDAASPDSKTSVTSAKWLSDRGYKADKKTVGRPAKSSEETFKPLKLDSQTEEELARIGLKH